jgi:hypothetical protein
MTITDGYCTLAELKAVLDVPVDFTDKDAVLERAIEGASRRIDGWCHRSFTAASTAAGSATARVYVPMSAAVLYVDDIANTAGLVVRTDDDGDGVYETTWSTTDWSPEPVNAHAKGDPVYRLVAIDRLWPTWVAPPPVQITANWGWPSVPHAVREACLLLAGRQFKRQDSLLGVAGFGDLGVISVRAVDPDVEALLRPFKRATVV